MKRKRFADLLFVVYICLILARLVRGNPVDLIEKVYTEAEYKEGIITTSLPCCSLNLTLEDYQKIATGPVDSAQEMGTLPFIWLANLYHEADFLQIDLRTVYVITSVHKRDILGLPDENKLEAHACAFSKHGDLWDPIVEPCEQNYVISPGVPARFIRFFPSAASRNESFVTKVSFLVFGTPVGADDYLTHIFHSVACHGYQARIDIELLHTGFVEKCTETEVTLKVNGSVENGKQFMDQFGHAAYFEWKPVKEFHKCVISFVVEAFQFQYNARFSLSVSTTLNANTVKYDSEETEFMIEDDGNENLNYFYIATSGGNYFISAVPYDTHTPNTVVKIGNVETVKSACSQNADNADVLTMERFERVQAGNLNHFIQSVIYYSLGLNYHNESAEGENNTFMLLENNEVKHCMEVEPTEIETRVCRVTNENGETADKAQKVLCMHTEGEISEINITSDSCLTEEDDDCVKLGFKVSVEIMGSRVARNITCVAKDFANVAIDGTETTITVQRDDVYFSIVMCKWNKWQVQKIICEALALVIDESDKPKKVTGEFPLDLTLPIDDRKVDLTPLNYDYLHEETGKPPIFVYYLHESNYGNEYILEVETKGYPIGAFKSSFQKKFDQSTKTNSDEDEDEDEDMVTDKQFKCKDDQKSVQIFATGRKTFSSLTEKNSGKYVLYVDTLDESITSEVEVELIHPYSIKCEQSCEKKVTIGDFFQLQCEVNHHFITDKSVFDNVDDVPLKVVITKVDPPQDMLPYTELNPCEYGLDTGKPLTTNNLAMVFWDVDKRKVDITFEIFSVQHWNHGEYQILVEVANTSDCYYQKTGSVCMDSTDMDLDACDYTETRDSRKLRFMVIPNKNFGSISAADDSCNEHNPRALFFAPKNDAESGLRRFYYKVCAFPDYTAPVDKVCGMDGGISVHAISDRLVENTVYAADRGIKDPLYDRDDTNPDHQYQLNKIWKAIKCNYYFHHAANPVSPATDKLETFVFSGGLPAVVSFDDHKLKLEGTTSSVIPTGLFCKYSRGYVWALISVTGSCRYTPLDLNEGMQVTVKVKTHGNDPVSILCQAVPFKSADNQTFHGLTSDETFVYKIDFPEEKDVESIQCAQYSEGLSDEEYDWFPLNFPSLYEPLVIDDNLTISNVWCNQGNSSLKQPCYDGEIKITSCVEGNPIQECFWKKHVRGQSSTTLVQGEDSISWQDVSETPQCNNTRKCSTLQISPLKDHHQGFYWYECLSGLEKTVLFNKENRRKSKMVKITAQQSAPAGDQKFEFVLECEKKRVKGYFRAYGQNVTASVQCQRDENSPWVDHGISYEVPGKDALDVVFYPEGATRTTNCRFEGSNEYASQRPMKFKTPMKPLKLFNTLSLHGDDTNELKVCCDACVFDMQDPSVMKLECLNSNGSPVPLRNETEGGEDFRYQLDSFTATRCRTMVQKPASLYTCKCVMDKKVTIQKNAIFIRLA